MKVKAPEGVPRTISIDTAKAQMDAIGLEAPTDVTLMNWIRQYSMGHKIGGHWVLIEEKFHAFLRGELERQEE